MAAAAARTSSGIRFLPCSYLKSVDGCSCRLRFFFFSSATKACSVRVPLASRNRRAGVNFEGRAIKRLHSVIASRHWQIQNAHQFLTLKDISDRLRNFSCHRKYNELTFVEKERQT